jgi:hypothetical protein
VPASFGVPVRIDVRILRHPTSGGLVPSIDVTVHEVALQSLVDNLGGALVRYPHGRAVVHLRGESGNLPIWEIRSRIASMR